jgi:hypothetical protein
MRLIGDVHGKYDRYRRILADGPTGSIQVGDMGIGFRHTQGPRAGEFYTNPPHYAMLAGSHRFIRGNHDNPESCRRHSQWISDGTIENGIMFIGGALSVDRAMRVPDHTWWADEELSIKELDDLITVYLAERPRVMITHECPEEVAAELERLAHRGKLDPQYASRTRQAFQAMWSAHSPEVWVFGHWHYSFDQVLRGTRFVCLAELEYRDDLI